MSSLSTGKIPQLVTRTEDEDRPAPQAWLPVPEAARATFPAARKEQI